MSGNGTFAHGNSVAYTYDTVGFIEGVKVLQKQNGAKALPEEAHSSDSYILLDKQGVFKMMRIYDKEHFAIMDIGYHVEPSIDKSRNQVLHVHEYTKRGMQRRSTRPITIEEYEKYKKYLKGVVL